MSAACGGLSLVPAACGGLSPWSETHAFIADQHSQQPHATTIIGTIRAAKTISTDTIIIHENLIRLPKNDLSLFFDIYTSPSHVVATWKKLPLYPHVSMPSPSQETSMCILL